MRPPRKRTPEARVQSGGPREGPTTKRAPSILEELQPAVAAAVLRELIAAHPELASEAEGIARSALGGISFEDIASEVAGAIQLLDINDLNGRAGRHSWGYTEPAEAAWELIEEEAEPFLEEMRRHAKLGLAREALEILKGIVAGLYECRNAKGHGFLAWAEDCPAEIAARAIDEWLASARQSESGGPSKPDFTVTFLDFAAQRVPEWKWIPTHISRSREA